MATKETVKKVLVRLFAGAAVLGIAAFAWVWFAPCWAGGCAPLDDLAAYQAEGSELLDVNEQSFGTLATVNRRVVPIDSLPDFLPRAFLAVEDRRFFDHGGIDVRRVLGALVSNVRAGGVAEGGSTITMQLARNLFPEWLPYRDRSMRRKIMEARVARQIEQAFPKEKILELYLNHIYLGEGAYGIEAAAQRYFGKPAAQLSLAEAAVLGGTPKAPSQINPVVNRKAARERRDLVLTQMADAGYITTAQAAEAKAEPIRLAQGEGDYEAPRGSYFVERVRQELDDLVGSRFYTAGLKIYTTLDPTAQEAAESELLRQLDAVEAGRFGSYRHSTYANGKGKSAETGQTPYLQGAVVVMDAGNGEVRALVGGRDFEDSKFDRATQASRQPGSAFKPFVYGAALERYGSPVHVVEDAPLRMVLDDGQVWEPKNYTGRYDGPMTLRDALARSKNTVTARLAQELGMGSVVNFARAVGITSDIPEVPSAALGSTEVRPIELVGAYAAFANGGYQVQPHFIRRVVDRHGQVLWEAPQEREQVIDAGLAFVLTSMLEDVVSRGTGTAVRAAGFAGPAAGKTGTTNDAADVWFIGYTPEHVAAVWMGLDDPETIVPGASGGTLAAPVWARVMSRIYAGRAMPSRWTPPPGVTTAEVEVATGMVASPECPATGPTYTEYFLGGGPPRRDCTPIPTYASMPSDTMWIDEEWGAGMYDDSLGYAAPPPTIDWPELEEMRARMRVGGSAPPAPPSEVLPGETLPPSSAPPLPATAPPPPQPGREPPPAPAEPRLLGEPIYRDSTAARDTVATLRSPARRAAGEQSKSLQRILSRLSSRPAAVSARTPTTGAHPPQG